MTRTAGPAPTSASYSAEPTTLVQAVTYPDGVQVRLNGIRRGVEKGFGPGTFPGRPYVVLDVQVVNRRPAALDLSQVVVSMLAGRPDTVVPPVYAAELELTDLSGTAAPNAVRAGRYAFAIPVRTATTMTVVVDLDDHHAPAVFAGLLPRSP